MIGKYFNNHNVREFEKISLLIVGISLFSFSLTLQSISAASFSLDDLAPTNLGDANAFFPSPQIDSSGNDVYAVWRDGVKILLTSSTNSGATFGSSNEIGDTGFLAEAGTPQIDVSGNNVYTVWRDDTSGDADIKFRSSNDRTTSFNAILLLSSSTNTDSSQLPQVDSSSSTHVYTVWYDQVAPFPPNGQILTRTSSDNGVTFGSIVGVGSTNAFLPDPQIASSGNNVYVVWQTSTNIKLSISSDNGASFSPAINVGDSGGQFSDSSPQIAALGDNVFVVWQQGGDIKFTRSTNNGVDFSEPSDIGDASSSASTQIAVAGNNVYVVWQEKSPASGSAGDIRFRASTDNGASLENDPDDSVPPLNISENAGSISVEPQLTALGDNVYVVWSDNILNPTNFEIFARVSDDRGSTFTSSRNLSEKTGFSDSPQISASGSKFYVNWQDHELPVTRLFDILFRSATLGGPAISFDEPLYRDSDSAFITVEDDTRIGEGTIDVQVISDSDLSGIFVTLTETSPGIFEGGLTFTTESSAPDLLQVKAGDKVTANFDGNNGVTTIFPRIIEFESNGFVVTGYDVGDFANIKVIDKNSNINPNLVESISVVVTTKGNPSGITLTLSETGPDTSEFGGTSKTNLIFMKEDTSVSYTGTTIISIKDTGSNTDPNSPDSINVSITTTSGEGLILPLTETGADTDTFSGELILSPLQTGAVLPNVLHAEPGDFVTTANGLLKTNFMVLPNHNPENGAILIAITPTEGDLVTATFKGVSGSADVIDGIGSGGGGGGLVRPGLVVNILAGAGLFGGGSGGSANPTFGDATVLVLENQSDGFGGTISDGDDISLDTTKIVKIGDEVVLRFELYENQGINNLERFRMFFNFEGENYDVSIIDTHVTYERGEKITIVDPHEKFEHVQIEILQEDAWNLIVKATVVFKNTFNTSILVESWDLERHSGKKLFPDALEVVESSILLPDSIKEFVKTNPSITQTELKEIPLWVKSNALWWQQKQIDDSDFMAGIKYLIQKTIIEIDENELANSITSKELPVWLRDMAGMWADDSISDEEFVNAMQWLINNGILEVKQ